MKFLITPTLRSGLLNVINNLDFSPEIIKFKQTLRFNNFSFPLFFHQKYNHRNSLICQYFHWE
jgi:hypothetical protein